MKIFVTGASGFIGRYLVPELVAKGHEVLATDLVVPDAAAPVLKGVEWERLDVSRPDAIYKIMLTRKPNAIIHLVSLLAGPCDADPIRGWQINFDSTQHFLNAGLASGLEQFLITSSISVFGRGLREPVPDNAVKEPATIYGQTKLACENLLRWYHAKHGIAVGGVRFPWVYGPGRENGITALYSSKLLDSIAAGEEINIDNPEEKGDWLYVRDAVKSLLLLLEKKNTQQLFYNIMGEVHTIRDALERAKTLFPEIRVNYREGGAPSDNPYPTEYDDSAARAELGWKPEYTLEQGMKEHVELVRAARTA